MTRSFGRVPLSFLLSSLLVAAAALPAQAETRRMALLVGSNRGTGTQPPLRFAESDAEKLAQVLVELGGVRGADALLIRGSSIDRVRSAMRAVRQRVEQAHAAEGAQVVLIFYFSGHSDGEALEIGADRLGFGEVREWLGASGADVRLAIIDSCRSGGLLAIKGGSIAAPFDFRAEDNTASTGEAFITSSAADEVALESAEIGGSFFSHHLISGLRGGADESGDGEVTLAEAYHYAFSRTLSSTARTIIGPQHAGYDYRLSGRGDLVLARLQRPAALVELPEGFDRVLLLADRTERVLLELGPRSARRLALPAGSYEARGWRGAQVRSARFRVAGGETVRIGPERFARAAALSSVVKGAEPGAGPRRATLWSAGVGVTSGVGLGATVLPSVRLGASPDGTRSISVSLEAAHGPGEGFTESRAGVRAGPRLQLGESALRLRLGADAGVAVATQLAGDAARRWSGMASMAAVLELVWRPARSRLGAALIGEAPLVLLRRDDQTVAAFLPSVVIAALFAL